ncbi:MAG: DUF3592 domain-containing protein [Oscillospiraceae bacterium]|nr:DUF3592 domain-containing protein [Oscillospiraceae bacterium]
MVEIIFGIFAALFALIFLAVGVLALVGGAQQQRRCRGSAEGIVSAVHTQKQHKGTRGTTVYTPEFRFDADGQTYTIKANFASIKQEYQEGQAVTIRYDPANPQNAYVADDPDNSSQGGVLCVCLGLLLTLGALALFA